jgi:transposase-like protein
MEKTANSRRRFAADEKMAILRRHVMGKESVSDICDELDLHPNQFHRWLCELFERGGGAFERPSRAGRQNKELKRLELEKARLEAVVDKKDRVIAEITEDYVRVKKNSGDRFMGVG